MEFKLVGAPIALYREFSTGAERAPKVIRKALGVKFEDLKLQRLSQEEANELIKKKSKEIFQSGEKPFFMGGDHSITLPILESQEKPFDVFWFDAHPDAYDFYKHRLSHATVLRRVSELTNCKKIYLIGSRVCEPEEKEFLERSGKVKQISLDEIKKVRSNRYYISVDIDVLDPKDAPAVDHPEKNGLSVEQLVKVLEKLKSGNLIGVDLVEFVPDNDSSGITERNAIRIIKRFL